MGINLLSVTEFDKYEVKALLHFPKGIYKDNLDLKKLTLTGLEKDDKKNFHSWGIH